MTEKERKEHRERMLARYRKHDGFGENLTRAEWAHKLCPLGLPRNSLWRYLEKGLTIEEIVEIRGLKYPE